MGERPGILPELILPALAVAFTAYYLTTVWELPFQARVVGLFVGGGIVILTLLLAIRFTLELVRGEKAPSFHQFFSTTEFETKRLFVLVSTIALIVGMSYVGFTVALFGFVFLNVLVLGGLARLKAALVTATAITVISFAVFLLAVRIRFPQSVVDRTLLAWIGG